MMSVAKLIRLTLVEGVPDGVRVAELAGRTTKLTACPVAVMAKALKRPEAQKTAVYFLLGQQFETTEPAIYIGECDAVAKRFNGKHGAFEKADWQLIVMASTSDAVFNKAHARRVEHLLVERAKIADRAKVFTEKSGPGELDEGDSAVAATFFNDVVMLAETLGVDSFRVSQVKPPSGSAFDSAHNVSASANESEDDIFRFVGEPSVKATMRVIGDECIVLPGSLARLNETDGCPPSVKAARSKAISLGLLEPSPDKKMLIVKSDIATGSSSGAGGLVAGRACRGPTEWVHSTLGQAYGVWLQAKQVGGDKE